MFLCTKITELECLEKQMVGTTQANAIWATRIRPGDDIYLFNFQTGVIRGPYLASSRADCYDAAAWGGQFPIQVKISKNALTKEANTRTVNAPRVLVGRKRPSGDLGAVAADLLLWLQESGEPISP